MRRINRGGRHSVSRKFIHSDQNALNMSSTKMTSTGHIDKSWPSLYELEAATFLLCLRFFLIRLMQEYGYILCLQSVSGASTSLNQAPVLTLSWTLICCRICGKEDSVEARKPRPCPPSRHMLYLAMLRQERRTGFAHHQPQ